MRNSSRAGTADNDKKSKPRKGQQKVNRMAAVLLYWLLLPFGFALCENFDNADWDLEIGDSRIIESPGYPDPMPDDTRFVWTMWTDPKAALVVKCDDFRLPQEPCNENGFSVYELTNHNTCGKVSNYKYVSKTNALYASLVVKSKGSHYLRCNVTSVKRSMLVEDNDGSGSQNPNNPNSYLDLSSEEVDSSEYGGPPGRVPTTCKCGFANKENQRIFYGKETKVNEYPFMVGIVKKRNPSAVFCGAGIITAHHALTAAHCVNNRTTGVGILVGEHDLQSASETSATELINVRQVISHPEYAGKPNYLNDIAVMVLERQIAFNTFVAPVCMPNGPVQLTNQYVTVMGWGATENEYQQDSSLKYIHVRVLSKPACHASRQPWVPAGSPNQLCVYGTKRSACFGDSGGPVVWVDPETNRYTVIGINSYGAKGCATQTPIVITDVATYLDWIHRVIRETNPNGVTCTKAS